METNLGLFHALAHPELELRAQTHSFLHWHKLHPSHPPHGSGKIMVCGHSSQRSGLPLDFGYAVCIDTWVYGDGWLTCLDVASGPLWQANRHGEVRTGWLDEPEEEPLID